ncbi:MAG TPA: polysaccharide biosynthesis/export family protein [Allosphingosinicella sp.]|jgi:polysaccharide export outer membrane protein
MRGLLLLILLLASALLLGGCEAKRGGPIAYDPAGFDRPPDAPRAPIIGSSYSLTSGDKVAITVYLVPELSREYTVDLAGNLALPLIGEIAAVGKTTVELDELITRRLGERYLRNPDVSVSITQSTNNNVTVEGGVRQSGVFPLTGQTSLIQAIALARGIDPQNGNARRVAIFRRIQNQRMAAAFDLVSIRRGEMQDPQIYPGDVVVVETNTRRGLFQDILQTLPLLAVFRPF